mgnify:CR=1 FL=1
MGGVGAVMGVVALWRIHRKGGTISDRFIALGGVVMGLLPIVSFCITVTLLARKIPGWVEFLAGEIPQTITYISREVSRLPALLSNLFR